MNTPPYQSYSSVLVRALLAYSIYEHGYEGGTATHVRLLLEPRGCTLEDNGRGIGLHRPGYVTGLVEQLTGKANGVALHGIGLALIAMSSPLMSIESRRDSRKFLQHFQWGLAKDAVAVEPWDGASGTRITFTLAKTAPDIDFREVSAQAQQWQAAHPHLQIEILEGAAHAL